jgi:hypothetical protein
MAETSDQIERHIQRTRNDLNDNFTELEEKVKSTVDWRAQFEERPGTMMALAFGGGLLLSAILPSVRSSRRRSSEVPWNAFPDRDAPPFSTKSRSAYDAKSSQSSETWDSLKGALLGLATTKLSGVIEELIPGFKDEFSKAKTDKNYARSDSYTTGQSPWRKSTAAGAD